MRRILAVLVSVVIFTMFAGPAYSGNAVIKLIRGTSNAATCPLELFNARGDKPQAKNDMKALIYKLSNRIMRIGKRALVGVYEVATFLFPIPAHYEPVMDDPEFFIGVNRSCGLDINI